MAKEDQEGQKTQSDYDSIIDEFLRNFDVHIETKISDFVRLLDTGQLDIKEEVELCLRLRTEAETKRTSFEKDLRELIESSEGGDNLRHSIYKLFHNTQQSIDNFADNAILCVKLESSSEVKTSSKHDYSSKKGQAGFTFTLLSLFLVLSSLVALYLVDTMNHKANEQEKKIVACENPKSTKGSNSDCSQDVWQLYRYLSNEKSSLSVAFKSFAMGINILFIIGLSGFFLAMLKVFHIEVADKIFEKLLDGIEKKSITDDSGTSQASILSTLFSGHALIGASVAATMGVAVINTSQQSTHTSNNNIFNNQEYAENKLNAVDELKSLIDKGLKSLPEEIDEIKQLVELHNKKELPEGGVSNSINDRLEEIKGKLDNIIKIDQLDTTDEFKSLVDKELKLLPQVIDGIKQLIKQINNNKQLPEDSVESQSKSVNDQLEEIKRKLASIDSEGQLKKMKKLLNDYYERICNDRGIKMNECWSF
ncbi:hypothetical protein [Nitrosomonas sp.]|uniref:hypothetical protein n=1 Tax=Nitrosomonas sp. TaxID=42353 RepID=UPI0025F17EFA|nr:hypothetical protein [Nitrosomonas sp.]MBV6449214.1 hypothetical protein [Nitrosomonas sp.]